MLQFETTGLSYNPLIEGACIPEGEIQANGHLAKNGSPGIISLKKE